ncbi:MAG: DUF2220 domain-containing protein [Spirochaetaceae bacterium]|jgi:hypothetical protein|nr:DUF2220 domain-containing protein [Spirochaetaceae bacterium]
MPANKHEKEILSRLLDKYEAGSHFKKGEKPARRIMLKLYDSGVSDYPAYDIENAEQVERINRAVFALHEEALVFYAWMQGEQDHFIARLWLNLENLDKAYRFLNRQPADHIAAEVCCEIGTVLETVKTGWIRRFLTESVEAISDRRVVGRGGPGNRMPGTREERQDLCRALCFIDSLGETEMLERVFSLRCFGDSKKFETGVKKRILDILKYYTDWDGTAGEDELLRFAGIVRYPQRFEFRGPLSLSFAPDLSQGGTDERRSLDFSLLVNGASFNSLDFRRGTIHLAPETSRILTIENQANYVDYLHQEKNKHELVVYHGGQFSPAKGLFFKALAAALPAQCLWYHWGDIDYGGFSMLARLRREITPGVLPYRMNEEDLRRYAAFTAPVKASYLEKLQNLKGQAELRDCFPCLAYMITHRIRLEQEALLSPASLAQK